LKAVEGGLLFQRVSLGFGWCLEGSQPLLEEDKTVDLRPWQRKRKRLDVLGRKATAREKVQVEKSGKGETEGEKIKLDESKGEGDGLSQVGRMCIWCVK
jgi:predicted CopG family antitoxin